MFQVGAAKIDMTPEVLGATMLGWGDPKHRVEGVATPLFARAIVIEAHSSRQIFLCLDICFTSELLRHEIRSRLKLTEAELMITATHTHSAPGGYSGYLYYELTGGGFHPEIFEAYVSASVTAIESAMKKKLPAKVYFSTGVFPDSVPVAFNRSIRAWNRNPEVKKVRRSDRHLAVDREMTLLRFDDLTGKPIACWNWFSVHATSMHRDRKKIHSDNKGVAAELMEKNFHEMNPDFVAVFSQGAAGDVSPNFKWYRGIKEKSGTSRNDDESCLMNATYQCNLAIEIFERAAQENPIEAKVDSFLDFYDFSKTEVNPTFVSGLQGLKTGPAEIGIPQLYGTSEGRGASFLLLLLLSFILKLSNLIRFRRLPWELDPIQGNKVSVVQMGRSQAFGMEHVSQLPIPDWADPTIANLKKWDRAGILSARPFTPQVLPLQLIRLGKIGIVAVPAEFSTVAGMRLCRQLERELKTEGVDRVLLQGYANAHTSYVVTPEEYDQQGYEGGCTHFGKWTLPAYQTHFLRMIEQFKAKERTQTFYPNIATPQYLKMLKRP